MFMMNTDRSLLCVGSFGEDCTSAYMKRRLLWHFDHRWAEDSITMSYVTKVLP